MRPQILLLAGLYDFSADLVALRLEELGISFFRLNREQLKEFRIVIDPVGRTVRIAHGDKIWELTSDLSAVWFRQPVFLRNLPAQPLSPEVQLERSQWMGLLRGLTLFENATWTNHPRETYRAESKILQLATAASAGFDVPLTVIGNDANAISAAFPDLFAIKPIDTVLLRDGGHDLFAYMSVANRSNIDKYDLAAAPVIAQELVTPKFDIRVTAIDGVFSAVRIKGDSTAIEGDWRLTSKSALTYETIDLPNEVEACCSRFMDHLGLIYAGIDLLETSNGYRFLEANPTGEFSWLISPERPYDRMIAEHLAQGIPR